MPEKMGFFNEPEISDPGCRIKSRRTRAQDLERPRQRKMHIKGRTLTKGIESRILRRIFRPNRDKNGGLKRLHNDKLST